MRKFFTSESVTCGHPDKVCDKIADSILDEILRQDPMARTAVECCAAYDRLLIMGEVTTSAKVDYEKIARDTIRAIGYDFGKFAYDRCKIMVAVHEQSPDIALGVDASMEKKAGGELADTIGAGDQGIMFGYACRETEELMPLPLTLAHRLAKRLEEVRKTGILPYLRPDGKTQVTVEYGEDGKPSRVEAVVVSSQHAEGVEQERLRADILAHVVEAVLPAGLTDENTKYYINPTGRFEIGGPEGDSGLTGRKIIVDTYGGSCPHGGGSFSGKDCTKVDRSATYMARYICKNIVAAGLADKLELQVAYAIGVARPVSVFADTFGTGKLPDGEIADIAVKEFDLRPYSIIETLGLRRPVYAATAAYGHFGSPDFAWEKTDREEALKKFLKK